MVNQLSIPHLTHHNYGSDPAEPDISVDELKRLCQEYLACLQVCNNANKF